MPWAEIIAGLSAVLCAVIAGFFARTQKREAARHKFEDDRAEQRKRESLLLLRLAHTSMELGLGTALALKAGKTNGEVDTAIKHAKEVDEEYTKFLEECSNDHLHGHQL